MVEYLKKTTHVKPVGKQLDWFDPEFYGFSWKKISVY